MNAWGAAGGVGPGSDRDGGALMSRRAVVRTLGASGALATLAACARDTPRAGSPAAAPGSASSTRTPAPSGSTRATAPVTPSATGVGPPTAPPSAGAALGRGEIVAKYGRQPPTYWGLSAPGVIVRGTSQAVAAGRVALTFDACGGGSGSGYDAELIALLRRREVPATLFLNHRWITARPRLSRELAADPLFEVASHGIRHLALSVDGRRAYGLRGTRDVGEVYDELVGNNATLEELTGAPVSWFRPGTAYCDDVAAQIARDLGTPVVNFSINGDGGATFRADQVATEVRRAGPGDIIIAHMNQPSGGTAEGFATALPRMLDDGTTFARLGEVLP